VAGENETLRALPSRFAGDVDVRLLDSADDALWEMRTNPPQAIIANVQLDGLSGLEMAEILPNFEVPTRLLLWSQSADASAQKQASSYGVYRFMEGPVSVEEWQTVVQEAIASIPEPAPAPVEPLTPEPAPQRPAPPAAPASPAAAKAPAAAPASPSKGGLAARAAAAEKNTPKPAEKAPAPAAAPSEGPMPGQRRREGTLVLTQENITPIRKTMSDLLQDLGAQSIMLTDRAGMTLVEVGSTDKLPMMIVLPLLSTSFSTAGEVARQLKDDDATTLYIHEGTTYDLYCFDVAQRYLLVLVFNKRIASSKIGAVWVNAKRAIRELREALS
jgi:CheY-like chemotaxis protein/predicted regulator of Ras-like GTPase activity (Roadblock/LC7/MglB family)